MLWRLCTSEAGAVKQSKTACYRDPAALGRVDPSAKARAVHQEAKITG